MNITNLEKEYARTITALNRTGILTLLPRSENLGVIGIDGKEYPVPTQDQLQEAFTRIKELVDRKLRQGFTQLQLTPIAMPASQFIDRVKTVVLKHPAVGKIIKTYRQPAYVLCLAGEPTPHIVPVGYWARDAGRKMHLSAHRTGNRLRGWVVRSMVRLGN